MTVKYTLHLSCKEASLDDTCSSSGSGFLIGWTSGFRPLAARADIAFAVKSPRAKKSTGGGRRFPGSGPVDPIAAACTSTTAINGHRRRHTTVQSCRPASNSRLAAWFRHLLIVPAQALDAKSDGLADRVRCGLEGCLHPQVTGGGGNSHESFGTSESGPVPARSGAASGLVRSSRRSRRFSARGRLPSYIASRCWRASARGRGKARLGLA